MNSGLTRVQTAHEQFTTDDTQLLRVDLIAPDGLGPTRIQGWNAEMVDYLWHRGWL